MITIQELNAEKEGKQKEEAERLRIEAEKRQQEILEKQKNEPKEK